jgi:hypothetical protein
MNAQPVRQLHADPTEYACRPYRIFVVVNVARRDLGAVPDLPDASVACAAPGVDGHQDLPRRGHEVGSVAITDSDWVRYP